MDLRLMNNPPDLNEARMCVGDVITHCVPDAYPADSKDKAVTAYMLRTPCVITWKPEDEHCLDAADLACLGNDMVEFIKGLAAAKGTDPNGLGLSILDKMIGVNGQGRQELARAFGYFRRVRQ